MTNEEGAPRLDLVAHLREQIARDPDGYANLRKLEAVADRLAEELRAATGPR